jgi:hypothetical protein
MEAAMAFVLSLILMLLLTAVLLYWLRERFRLIYGGIELVFGFILLAVVVNSLSAAQSRACLPIIGGEILCRPSEGALRLDPPTSAWLAVAAAVYIIVRGLDNFGEGLGQLSNQTWYNKWRAVFPQPSAGLSNASHEHPTS